LLKRKGLCADAVGVEVDEGVELWVEALDLADVFFGQFERGDFSGVEQREQLDGRLRYQRAHFAGLGLVVSGVERVGT
jgi:hypothetical protein